MLFDSQIRNRAEFRDTNYKIYVWDGSVRSGKTTNISACILTLMQKCPTGKFAIIGVSQTTIERNVIDSLREVLGHSQVRHNEGKQKVYICGRTFWCIGATDNRAEDRIRGATFAGAIVDEVTNIPEPVFRTIVSRVSLPGSCMLCSTNPDGPQHWFKTDYIDKAEEVGLKHFIMRLEDNPHLPKDYLKTLKASHSGVWYQRFILGEWSKSEGLVFPSFNESCTINDHMSHNPQWSVSVDFGTTNPCAFLMIGSDYHGWPKVWVEDERYFDSKKEGYHKTELEHVRDCIDFCRKRPVKQIFVDPSAISFITALRKEIRHELGAIPVKEGKNSVLQGIMKTGNLISTGDLKINKRCKNLIKEMYMYSWSDQKTSAGKDEPKKNLTTQLML